MSELKNQIEAILFASGKKVTYEDLARICNVQISEIKAALKELKEDLEGSESALLLTEETDGWKLTVREKYLSTVQKLLPETELSKTILETLAVIAWKHPVLQADVIKIRTNKAYDHIKELEELGFITKEKKGRSYQLKVSTKFREYFELPGHDDIKKVFKDVEGTLKDEKLNELEVVDEPEITPHKLGKMDIIDVQKPKEKLPELEVVDVPQEEVKKEKIEVKEEGEEETEEPAEEESEEVPAEKEESEEEEK